MVKQRAPREPRKAHDLFARAVDAGLPLDLDARARREMAVLARRERDYERSAAIWQTLASEPSSEGNETNDRTDAGVCTTIRVEALEQLAVHYERRKRDPRRALEYANQGLSHVMKAQRTGRESVAALARVRYRLYERIARLERKSAELLV